MKEEYIISVNKIEELQTIKDIQALEIIMDRARRTIIGGGTAILVRESGAGKQERFDTFTNEDDFRKYQEQVFKYL